MKTILGFGLACTVLLSFSCRSLPKQEPNDVLKSSTRTLVIPDSELEGISYDFCPDKKTINLTNALWLHYFASNQYAHFKELGPKLEALGFGDKGEGSGYLRAWYELRIKRISEKLKDKDDIWNSEQERQQRLESVKAEYEAKFDQAYADDGISAADFEVKLTAGKDPSGKIQFMSGFVKTPNHSYQKTSSQAFYAERADESYAILSFRGTEVDEVADIARDLSFLQTNLEGLGAVHSGFYEGYRELEDQLMKILNARSSQHPLKLWVTGHSLGAALATIFTARVLQLYEAGKLTNVKLMGTYHLGSPRVGNDVFADKFDRLLEKYQINYLRFRNYRDLVTGVPPGAPSTPGFWHAGALAYYAANGNLYFGDGWEDIEKNSDLKASLPNSAADHKTSAYWQHIKDAWLQNEGGPLDSCEAERDERPLRPFKENPKSRVASQVKSSNGSM